MKWLSSHAILLFLCLLPGPAWAHEVRPAFLQIEDGGEGHLEVLWKAPLVDGKVPPIEPLFPAHCEESSRRDRRMDGAAIVETWRVSCGEGSLAGSSVEGSRLEGSEVRLAGLEHTVVDVFVEVVAADGSQSSLLLKADRTSFVYGADRGGESRGHGAWFRLGVEHLLFGFDHILFVIGLVLLLRKPRDLVRVITSFTIAHSLTLGLSAVGGVTFNQSAVEAVIALSILILAVELAKPGLHGDTLIFRYPWSITFVFGLLHGFGFAGAISEIGLPDNSAIMALLLFNVGVEVGQLMIVAVMLVFVTGLGVLRRQRAGWGSARLHALAAQLPGQCMGIVASYWFMDRTLGLMF
jgi:hydrogenase/urease accessory protein HupE